MVKGKPSTLTKMAIYTNPTLPTNALGLSNSSKVLIDGPVHVVGLPRTSKTKHVCYSLASYNMHGYRQGITLLKEQICSPSELDIDVVFIQENWLTPRNLYKMDDIFNGYKFSGKSAMENAVSTSVLRGRPWGGVGFLIKQELCRKIFF